MKFSTVRNKILICLAILLLTSFLIFFQKEVRNIFYFISAPIQKVFWKAGDNASNFFKTISTFKNIKKQNEELLLKNQELLSENSQLKELKKENETLREALNLSLQKDFQLEKAEVISRNPFQDYILINKGEKSGISRGMPILTSGKVILGKITEVYDKFSKVTLISDKSSSFDAKVSEKDVFGVVKGEGNFSLILDLVSQNEEIKEGDLVITSSLGGIFPEGLLVGQIKEVKKSDIQPYQKAVLNSSFNIANLETVFIVTNF